MNSMILISGYGKTLSSHSGLIGTFVRPDNGAPSGGGATAQSAHDRGQLRGAPGALAASLISFPARPSADAAALFILALVFSRHYIR